MKTFPAGNDPMNYRPFFEDPVCFASCSEGFNLRRYQGAPLMAIVRSVQERLGLSFVVLFPRQSGKNELQAQLEAFLLTRYLRQEAEIVKVSPTWKPQSLNAMRRLERVLERNSLVEGRWTKESNYIYRVGKARIYFLSGMPEANIVGATASTLLEVDEAQDVSIEKFDKEIAPMAASSNATRVFWGTAWTSRTLLARELAAAQEAERQDGRQRAFILTAEDVSREVPEYGAFVRGQIARLGRNNPMVRSQFFSETIDAEGGMFNRQRQALMQGRHAAQGAPVAGHMYGMTIDVAGEDEAARDSTLQGGAGGRAEDFLQNPGRDATALTIFDIVLPEAEPHPRGPEGGRGRRMLPSDSRASYQVVARQQWTGIRHASLFARLSAIIDLWQPAWIVVDATGIGQTLSSFLFEKYRNVLPFVFTSSSKSALGWAFLALIETGRYKEYAPGTCEAPSTPAVEEGPGVRDDPLQREFWRQIDNCQYDILEGAGRIMRWGVPDGSRDPATGDFLHDDLVISAALVSQLDEQPIGPAVSQVLKPTDPIDSKEF